MALPADGQNANGLTKVTQIPAGKELMFIDPTTNEGGIITLEDLTKQILNGLTSQTFGLDSGTQTLPAAINYLYGNSLKYKDVRYDVSLTFPSNGYIEFPTNSETKSIWELNNLSGLNIIGAGILNWNASIVYGVNASGIYVYGPSGKQTRNLSIRYYYT